MGALAGVPHQRYSEEDIERGLQALAIHAGNDRAAEEETGIPKSTLCDWRRSKAERYAEIRAEVLPGIRLRTAAMFEDNIVSGLDKARDMLDGLDPAALSSAEKSQAIQRLAVATGVWADKAAAQRGLPQATVEHATGEEILRRFRAASPNYVTPTPVEEITDAEVVHDTPAARTEADSQRALDPAS